MNAAGLQRDVETLLHEGGHAFHFLAARDEPLVFLRSAPMEFCEVASMSMELLGSEHFDVFYNDADAARARRKLIEGIIRFLPWMATIDSFQHWIYTHPGHTPRRAHGRLALACWTASPRESTGPATKPPASRSWQRQLHLFHAPFYYIEYGIAQLGALQLWMKAEGRPPQGPGELPRRPGAGRHPPAAANCSPRPESASTSPQKTLAPADERDARGTGTVAAIRRRGSYKKRRFVDEDGRRARGPEGYNPLMSYSFPSDVAAPPTCPRCGTTLAPADLLCPGCGGFVHEQQLAALSQQ